MRRKIAARTPKFDRRLSRQIDRATFALEQAEERGDRVRAVLARAWLRKLERRIPLS